MVLFRIGFLVEALGGYLLRATPQWTGIAVFLSALIYLPANQTIQCLCGAESGRLATCLLCMG